jgi:hypothetical protein
LSESRGIPSAALAECHRAIKRWLLSASTLPTGCAIGYCVVGKIAQRNTCPSVIESLGDFSYCGQIYVNSLLFFFLWLWPIFFWNLPDFFNAHFRPARLFRFFHFHRLWISLLVIAAGLVFVDEYISVSHRADFEEMCAPGKAKCEWYEMSYHGNAYVGYASLCLYYLASFLALSKLFIALFCSFAKQRLPA